ncbi:MAG: nickel-dependent hydrogenase large subunit [Eggerthellales bacterium]|nr:nickel-dependent hydrogenase large subunit [Eggerthellales bacterium]
MTRSVIDPITRIEGHLRAEMEVGSDGRVSEAWMCGCCFRGMELVVRNRKPEDASFIVQRICGVCPTSHGHSATIAAERSLGITIPNNARIIRNIIEGAETLHSHILWFYNLAALDYVDPLNGAYNADPATAHDVAEAYGLASTDFAALKDRLVKFAKNGQLSIFSGNWFKGNVSGSSYHRSVESEFVLPPEADLILTAHYLEALTFQAKSSEIAGIIGGKMPHPMTIIPGGTDFVPTMEKLDDLKGLVDEICAWVDKTILPDTLAVAKFYGAALTFGDSIDDFGAFGVFERPFDASTSYVDRMNNRYFPGGIFHMSTGKVDDVDESLITEYVGHSWYEGEEDLEPFAQGVRPAFTEYNVEDRYTWNKCPRYDKKPLEVGPLGRVLVAYGRGDADIKGYVDTVISELNKNLAEGLYDEFKDQIPLSNGKITVANLNSTLGRVAARNIETVHTAHLMQQWITELCEALASGDSTYFVEATTDNGYNGAGLWEAPRGALYHAEKIEGGLIKDYQIIIPTTWNIAPKDPEGVHGPMEQALVGVPVADVEKPINALRTVHSYDPCTACAVHVVEPKTGKSFETVTSPWGVK